MEYAEIEAIRKKLGITRAAFAERLGIKLSTYYSWSQPGKEPKGSTLVLLKQIRERI